MKSIFLDTDVLIEFLSDETPQAEFTTAILTLAEQKQLKVFVSPLLYADLYNRFLPMEGHKKLIGKLRKLNLITRALRVNNKIIKQAINSDFENFDTGLKYYTAKTNKKIEAIITNNVAAYGHSKIALFTPETYLITLQTIPN